MPLVKSSSKNAFRKNIKAEVAAGLDIINSPKEDCYGNYW